MYKIVRVEPHHVAELALTMRDADVAECWATSHSPPLEALESSVRLSEPTAYVGLADGVVVCMFGVGPQTLSSDVGVPWMLGSDLLVKHYRAFARHSCDVVYWMREKYPKLRNSVDARNILAVRWLKWLGFTIETAVPFGPDDVYFHPFYWDA